MRKRNRQRKTYHLKLSQVSSVALLSLLILPWAWPAFVDLSNEQTATQIKNLEYTKRSLGDSLRRQTADWNRLVQPENLDEAVRQNGFKLSYAAPERSIIVHRDGRMEIPAALHASLEARYVAQHNLPKNKNVASVTDAGKKRAARRR